MMPYRSGQPISHDTFIQLLRAEFNQFRAVRSWMLSLSAVMIALDLLSFVVAEASTIMNGYFPISPWGGLAVLAAYTLAALGGAMGLLPRHRAP